jgi:hypothetical protein
MNVVAFPSNLCIIYIRRKIIKTHSIMKKQKSNSIQLKINKISIANLTTIRGGDDNLGKNNDAPETYTCSQFPLCFTTVATRPDSLYAGNTTTSNDDINTND